MQNQNQIDGHNSHRGWTAVIRRKVAMVGHVEGNWRYICT